MSKHHSNRGFGLIELMVAIVIGLIVVAGITSLVVSSLRANTENLQLTRLTQEVRGVMQIVTRDLRRAGYDEDSIRDFGAGSQASNDFTQVRVFDGSGNQKDLLTNFNDGTCVLFSYDANSNGTAEADEFRGFRYDADTGAVQAKTSGAAADADCSAGTWETLTDTQTVNVEEFSFSTRAGGAPVLLDSAGNPVLTIRELIVSLETSLVDDASVQRSSQETVRVRNDLLN